MIHGTLFLSRSSLLQLHLPSCGRPIASRTKTMGPWPCHTYRQHDRPKQKLLHQANRERFFTSYLRLWHPSGGCSVGEQSTRAAPSLD